MDLNLGHLNWKCSTLTTSAMLHNTLHSDVSRVFFWRETVSSMDFLGGRDTDQGGKNEDFVLKNDLLMLKIYPLQHALNVSMGVKTYFTSPFLSKTLPIFTDLALTFLVFH